MPAPGHIQPQNRLPSWQTWRDRKATQLGGNFLIGTWRGTPCTTKCATAGSRNLQTHCPTMGLGPCTSTCGATQGGGGARQPPANRTQFQCFPARPPINHKHPAPRAGRETRPQEGREAKQKKTDQQEGKQEGRRRPQEGRQDRRQRKTRRKTRHNDQHDWASRGPPDATGTAQPTHSWLYVFPLLPAQPAPLHSAGSLENAANTAPAWQRLLDHLRQPPPIRWPHLHHILITLQHVAIDTGQALQLAERAWPATLDATGACLPPGTLVYLPWAVSILQQPTEYIAATAQEALLQAYLGDHPQCTNQWPSQPAPQNSPDQALDWHHPPNTIYAMHPPQSTPMTWTPPRH